MGSKQTIIGNPLLITDLTVGNYVIQCKARGGNEMIETSVHVTEAREAATFFSNSMSVWKYFNYVNTVPIPAGLNKIFSPTVLSDSKVNKIEVTIEEETAILEIPSIDGKTVTTTMSNGIVLKAYSNTTNTSYISDYTDKKYRYSFDFMLNFASTRIDDVPIYISIYNADSTIKFPVIRQKEFSVSELKDQTPLDLYKVYLLKFTMANAKGIEVTSTNTPLSLKNNSGFSKNKTIKVTSATTPIYCFCYENGSEIRFGRVGETKYKLEAR